MPSKVVNVMVTYGGEPALGKMNIGDTFRIFTNLPGKFEIEYTKGTPFRSTDPGNMRHRGGLEREATLEGKFPFRCFIDDKEFKNSDGTPALAGSLEVPEG